MQVWQDLRYGLRRLAKSPGFTAVAVVSLALGICIATCAYSEINGLLRDLPGVLKPDELVALQAPSSYPQYQRYRQLADLFTSSFAYVAPVPFAISIGGRTRRTWGHLVTPSYFSTLGARPLLGRFFDPQSDGHTPVVVLSHRFWREQLGGDRSVIGKALRMNGYPCTVIGVGPPEFLGASPALFVSDVWLPVTVDAQLAPELAGNVLERTDLTMFQVVGRLKPGIREDHAEAELDAVTRKLEQDYGVPNREDKGRRVQLVAGGKLFPIRKQDIPFFREFLLVLGGLVLLIACFNVANMMLARAAGRRSEMAVRLSLGAGRARLIRQLLAESLLVAAVAAAPAFLLCVWLMHLMSQLRMPVPIPVTLDLNPDWRALLFALGVTAVTGIGFGLAPALEATRTDLSSALKQGGKMPFRRYRRWGLRHTLVLCQMAASLTLLLLTGYMGLGIQSTLGVQEGFNPKNLFLISLDPVRDGYSPARATDFFTKLLDRVKRLPSVRSACLTDTVPVAIDGSAGVRFSTDGSHPVQWARRHTVGHDYFETAAIRILAGRSFRKVDEVDGATAVIVSEELVRQLGTGMGAVGRRLDIGNDQAAPGLGALPGTIDFRSTVLGNRRATYEIVGVAHDVTEDLVAGKKHAVIYFPLRPADYAQPSLRGVTLMVRAAPGADVLRDVRRQIGALDASLTPFNGRSMIEQIAQFMSALRAASWTYGLIGLFGLILASVGLAGVTAYSVTRRGHEIGIRLALGAQRRDVLRLVMKEGISLVVAGTVIGLALAWAGIRAMSGMFFSVASVQGADPVLLIGAPLVLAGLALLACFVPARRSTHIDPAVALRQE